MATAVEKTPKRYFSWIYLLIGTILYLVAAGKWIAPLAVFFAPLFLLRFIRLQKRWFLAYLVIVFALALTSFFNYADIIPVNTLSQYLGIIIVSCLISGLPFLADRLLSPKFTGILNTLIFPLTFTLLEYGNNLFNSFGNWGALAYTQALNLSLIQIVAVFGTGVLCFFLSWFPAAANQVWENEISLGKNTRGFTICLSLLLLMIFAGELRLTFFPPSVETVRVAAIVQKPYTQEYAEQGMNFFSMLEQTAGGSGSEDPAVITGFKTMTRERNQYLLDQSRRAAKAGAKIVFWSEAAALMMEEDEAALLADGAKLAQAEQVYLGLSLQVVNKNPNTERNKYQNKFVFFSPDGNKINEYRKHILVPGWEAQNVEKGKGDLLIVDTPYGKIAPAICFDRDFPDYIRELGRRGVDILLVPTGDWLALDPIHSYSGLFRGIENGFSVVIASINGLSAATDYQGRFLSSMHYFQTTDYTMIAHVPTKGVRTIYPWLGDIFGLLSIPGCLILTILALRKKASK